MAIPAVAERVAALLRSAPDANLPIPRLRWTVAETAAHLVIGARACTDRVAGADSPLTDLRHLADWNAQQIGQIPERRAGALADLLLTIDSSARRWLR
jgi:hypothetical protein